MSEKTIKILDLFSGAGGLSLGFDLIRTPQGKRAFEVHNAVEIDEDACNTLRNYFKAEYGKDDIVVQGDLTDKNIREKIIRECKKDVTVIVGGPPCQSFSTLGPRSGYGLRDKAKYQCEDKDRLYQEYLRIVDAVKPSFIVFENVKGIISKKDSKERRYIDIISADFKNLGYSFQSANTNIKEDYLILNAADYGVPQLRERVFLIGNRCGVPNPFPQATHFNPQNKTDNQNLLPWTTLKDAIGDLPELKAQYTFTDIRKKQHSEIQKLNSRRFSGAEELPFNEKDFLSHFNRLERQGQALLNFIRRGANGKLLYHEARAQKRDDIVLFVGLSQGSTAEQLFARKSRKAAALRKLIKYRMKTDDGEFTFGDKYRKQSWDMPSTTLFAHLAKDGNRFIHPDSRQARTYTVREAARIQTFPDWYEFCGSRGSKFRQIGNAVPPLLAYAIAKSLYGEIRRLTETSV